MIAEACKRAVERVAKHAELEWTTSVRPCAMPPGYRERVQYNLFEWLIGYVGVVGARDKARMEMYDRVSREAAP